MKIKFGVIRISLCAIVFLVASVALAETERDVAAVVAGNSSFGFELYQKLSEKEGNIFFSPYSISTALAMTYAGAKGQTEKEMAGVLHFSLPQEKLPEAFSKLQSSLNALQNKGCMNLSIANSLWAQKDYHFLESFWALNKKYYGAGLQLADFRKQSERARQTINTWVEEKTQQKIKELFKPGVINPETRLILGNAIYFKGKWVSQFEVKETVATDFYVTPRETIKVPMMSQTAAFTYKDFDDFSAMDLPYIGNGMSMIIFLPKEVAGLKKLEKNLTNDKVKNWINELSKAGKSEVIVTMPKFKITAEFELSETLSAMGMPRAFINADFSGMTGEKDLYLSNVVHKAFVEINEEGTEAAAATGVSMGITAIVTPLVFRADHPFIFLIRENQTGSILFVGRIVDPTKE